MNDPRHDPLLRHLHVAPEFVSCDAAYLFSVCNGCGAKGSRFRPPHRMWGLSVLLACQIHDWDWHHAKTYAEKSRADQRFLLNMLILIELGSANSATRTLRSMRAIKYYCAVRDFGDDAFWEGKERA